MNIAGFSSKLKILPEAMQYMLLEKCSGEKANNIKELSQEKLSQLKNDIENSKKNLQFWAEQIKNNNTTERKDSEINLDAFLEYIVPRVNEEIISHMSQFSYGGPVWLDEPNPIQRYEDINNTLMRVYQKQDLAILLRFPNISQGIRKEHDLALQRAMIEMMEKKEPLQIIGIARDRRFLDDSDLFLVISAIEKYQGKDVNLTLQNVGLTDGQLKLLLDVIVSGKISKLGLRYNSLTNEGRNALAEAVKQSKKTVSVAL